MNNKEKKIELIKNGTYGSYRNSRKEQWNNDLIPNEDPSYYNVTEEEKTLLDNLEKSTKRKKSGTRKHVHFMYDFYENVGLCTLSFSDKALDKTNFDTKQKIVNRIMKKCFKDYVGHFEISPNGRLHVHLIVAWDGPVNTFICNRYDEKKKRWFENTLVKKDDLQELWYGGTDTNGQPTKYGIYDLVLIDKNKESKNKSANYILKTLNTMESYITKDEQIDFSNLIDDELVLQVNTANIITPRNTPYQKWKKDTNKQDKEIKKKVRVFEPSYYDKYKYNSIKYFREWAIKNKNTKPTNYLRIFDKDFKLIETENYKQYEIYNNTRKRE